MTTFLIQQGTLVTWAPSGGDLALGLTSLASDAYRQGAKRDLGASFAEEWGFRLETKFASGPTADTMLRLALAFSEDNTTFAGEASGSDAAYTAGAFANLYELTPMLVRAVTTIQAVVGTFRPLARYVAPVVFNDGTGQALSSTAGDHKLIIWPLAGVAA